MLKLPRTTEFNKRIPKGKFYENIDLKNDTKRAFIDDVKTIIWKNKIATTTTNLEKGEFVREIEIFEIKASNKNIDENILKVIDRAIPYHIVFLVEYESKYRVFVGFKEILADDKVKSVNKYFKTEWLEEKELPLEFKGLNIDTVYENFVRQVGGEVLKTSNSDENLKETVEKNEMREKLLKDIEKLENRLSREKQFNKQMEINGEIKKLKRELEWKIVKKLKTMVWLF